MKTITLAEPGRFVASETEAPDRIGPGEALVRVRRIGVCGTDLHAFRGRQPFFSYPRILGHELGVEIEAVGENAAGLRVGDRCAVEPYLNCGRCVACRRGRTNCCTRLEVLGVHVDGGMRERIVVPVEKLHRSGTLSLDALALVEMLCIGAHAVARARPESGEPTLVVGAGPIGLSVIAFAQRAGADVIAMDVREDRLAFAHEALGVRALVDARTDPEGQLDALLDGERPTLVFDVTGSKAAMEQSFAWPAASGRLVLVGLVQDRLSFFDPDFHRRELTLLSSRNATGDDFREVIATLESGALDIEPWITHRADFDDMIEAFPAWLDAESGVVKAEVKL